MILLMIISVYLSLSLSLPLLFFSATHSSPLTHPLSTSPYLLLILSADNVEMEIVLPGSMTVIDSHDIALALQHKIEAMVDVERAFVHVDHQERDGLEHKVSDEK